MAAVLDADQELVYASFPIAKWEKVPGSPDDDIYVFGKATDGSVDSDDQIVDPVWAAKAMKDWLDTGGNVRIQHNPSRDPAGIGIEVVDDGRGGQWVKSLVVEPVAKNLVMKKVLQAYSVGIMRPVIVPDQLARNGRIVGGELGELSLVDRPANKGCRFELVKSFGGNPQFVGKMFGTETLNKAFVSDTVTVEVPRSAKIKVTPADLAKMLMKRDFDPNVGGGVDRDKIPDEDFAGPDRSFPIVKPDDVADVAPNLNHPNLKGDPAQIKQRAMAIARRKGPEFEAQIPDSWKNGGDSANKSIEDNYQPKPYDSGGEGKGEPVTCPNCGKGDAADAKYCDQCGFHLVGGADVAVKAKKPFEGASKPFVKDNDGDGKPERGEFEDEADEKDDEAKPEVTKGGGKDCPECGKTYHADAKTKKCENCGAKLPKADDDSVAKGSKGTAMGDGSDEGADSGGSEQDDDLDDSDEGSGSGGATEFDDKGDGDDKPAKKAARKALKRLAKQMALEMIEKGEVRSRPTPADGVTAMDADPVPAHREPDGPAIEAFEADAKLPTDPDAQYKALMYTKGLNIPDDLATLHDLLCPAYSGEAAHAAHPHTSLKSMDLQTWRERAFKAATSATMEEALAATKRLEHIGTLTQAPDFVLDELHREAHAAFKAINPENTTSLRPGSITPGSFRRPYMSSNARPSFQQQGPNSGPGGFSDVSPNDFERGYLTGGRADNSPSGGGSMTIPKPSTTGVPKSVDYTGAMRDNARQAMNAMHDHIAQTYPDLCAMRGPGDTAPSPTAVGLGKSAKKAEAKAETATVAKAATIAPAEPESAVGGLDMLLKSFGPDVIKGAMDEALAPIRAQLDATQAELKDQRKANKALRSQLDKMASEPDPRVAPFRGEAYDMVTKTSGSPVGLQDPAGVAARVQLLVQNELVAQSHSTDPAQREAALLALYKMRGIG